MALLNILTSLCVLAALLLQVIALCGNLPGLRDVYFVRVDAVVTNSLIDRIRHNIFGIPDTITFAAFVICQSFTSGKRPTLCTDPSLGYRYDANGLLGTLEDAIPEDLHRFLSVAQAGVLIPSACFCFFALMGCMLRACRRSDRLGRPCILSIIIQTALAFSLASIAVEVAGYKAVGKALGEAEERMPGRSVQLASAIGPAIWITVAAAILLAITTIIYIGELCHIHRRHKKARWQQQQQALEMGPVHH